MNILSWLQSAFPSISYYLILTLTLVWGWVLARACYHEGFHISHFFRTHRRALALTLLAASFIFLSVPRHHRVLSDETVLLSVAQTMTYEKKADYVTEGLWHHERFWPTNRIVQSRPILFPFFIHLLHVLLGYRVGNVYVLNYLALSGLLFSVYLILRAYLSEWWAFGACILVLSQPVISLSATSGSYEIFNCFFLALSLLSLRWFINTRSVLSLDVLLVNLLMLANIRYESIIFLFIIVLLYVDRYISNKMWMSALIPGAVLIFSLSSLVWKVAALFNQQFFSGGQVLWRDFGLKNMGRNMNSFLNSILDLNGKNCFAGLLDWFGLIVLILFLFFLIFKRKEGNADQKYFFLICLLVTFSHFILTIFYGGGMNSHPMNGRYYFPFLILVSVMPAVAMGLIGKKISVLNRYGFLLIIFFFVYYHPVAVVDQMFAKLPTTAEKIYIEKFLEKNSDKNSLLICRAPWEYTPYNRGAVSFMSANAKKAPFLKDYSNHIYSDIFVAQDISVKTNKPMPGLDPSYALEILVQIKMQRDYILQISRVKQLGILNK